jgi:hypothetical protein
VTPDDDEPNVGSEIESHRLTLKEFRRAYAEIHRELDIELPEALT